VPPEAQAAYAALSPDAVLGALEAVGLHGDGRILQLNSFENRVFMLYLEGGSAVVTKFYRPGRWSDEQILEEHAFGLELADAEVPVVPPLALADPTLGPASGITVLGTPPTLARVRDPPGGHRFSVAERCAGREPDLEAPGVLERIGAFIGRLHRVGARQPFERRRRIDIGREGEDAIAGVLASGFLPDAQRDVWRDAAQRALDAAADAARGVGKIETLRLHGDCHPGNVLWRDGGPHAVDLDDACTGPAVQDFWMLVCADAQAQPAQWRALLSGYEQFMPFDRRQLALVEPLRTLRMLRHSHWLAERWTDPAFPLAFGHFGTAAYWSEQTMQLREQCLAAQDDGSAFC